MKKKHIILVAVIVLVLIAAIAVLAILNAPKDEINSGTITVVSDGETVAEFSMEDIQAMDYIEVEKELVSASHENDEGVFRGVPLRAVLSACEDDLLNDMSQVVVRSEDAFVAAYSADDVMDSDSIFLAYSKNGESLENLDNGGTGPFRIIVADDEFGNRCAKYVYELEIK